MPKKLPQKPKLPEGEFTPPDSGEPTSEQHNPAGRNSEKSSKFSTRKKDPPEANTVAHNPKTTGAKFTPMYAERTPQMWAVGEVDIRAISDDSLVANIAFSISSFLLGFVINIVVTYGGADKLTDMGSFMLHKVTILLGILSLVFLAVGIVMTWRKNSIWTQIKTENKPTKQ